MKIKRFEVAGLAQYSYVLSSGRQAIVIDPMRDFDRYTNYAQEQGIVLKYVTETIFMPILLPVHSRWLKPLEQKLS